MQLSCSVSKYLWAWLYTVLHILSPSCLQAYSLTCGSAMRTLFKHHLERVVNMCHHLSSFLSCFLTEALVSARFFHSFIALLGCELHLLHFIFPRTPGESKHRPCIHSPHLIMRPQFMQRTQCSAKLYSATKMTALTITLHCCLSFNYCQLQKYLHPW